MSNRVFVGGLSYDTTTDGLRQAFEECGEITDALVVTDRETGRSRGFGFITFAQSDDARSAVQKMNETDLDGRSIRVDLANERPPRGEGRSFRGGRDGGFRGGDRRDDRRGGGGGYDRRDNRGGDRGYDRGGDRGGERRSGPYDRSSSRRDRD
ncbi:hypothetical protein HDV05_006460 [Chytridiales sp. JEL 0842]|nr:hypothetical protein HDV05_006460 [Chytridiales sp. JEL 0842]